MKRIQLIPLLILIFCSGVSLSSGLYYEVNILVYLFPISLVAMAFYFLRLLLEGYRNRNFISMGITYLLSMLGFHVAKSLIVPGLARLYNDVSERFFVMYGMNLGRWESEGQGSVALAVCQLLAFVTVLSLYFYETSKPVVLTAVPSFLMFVISISADGVPHEACLIAYAGAMIVFLGMGRYGSNVKKFFLLTGCTIMTGFIVFHAFSWPKVDSFLREYRNQILIQGVSDGGQNTEEKEEDKKEKVKQTINFGQFNQSGDITYTGTVELYVCTKKKFNRDELFLRGFVGFGFRQNNWFGYTTRSYLDMFSNVFPYEEKLEITKEYDRGEYVPFSVNKGKYKKLLNASCGVSENNMVEYIRGTESLKISKKLKDRIDKEILIGIEPETIGDAVTFVKKYLADQYAYTLHPGPVVDGVNEIEKFLFDRKSGYCTHFSSAAVMIFRSMGIPSRIAQGYMVSGTKLKKNEQVPVYDSYAHAWTEIYVDGQGWIPVDVTPYTNGEWIRNLDPRNVVDDSPAAEENPDDTPIQQENQEGAEIFEETEEDEGEEEEEEEETEDTSKQRESVKDTKKDRKNKENKTTEAEVTAESDYDLLKQEVKERAVKYGSILAALVFIFLFGRWLVRGRQCSIIKKQMESGDYSTRLRYINDELMKFWSSVHAPWKYEDSEKMAEDIYLATGRYYALNTTKDVKALKVKIKQYVQCVYISRFGKNDISAKEYEICMTYLMDLFRRICSQVSKKKWKNFQKCSMVKILYKKSQSGGKQNYE